MFVEVKWLQKLYHNTLFCELHIYIVYIYLEIGIFDYNIELVC